RKLVGGGAGELVGHVFWRRARLAFLHTLAESVEAAFRGVHMGEVEALEIAHGKLAEDVIENRGRVFDRVVALHWAGGFETGKGEGVDIFLERHAILQAERDRDREVVEQRAQRRALL